MTPEQWDRAKTIIERAVRHTPSERAAFVASACADDPPLLRQIQSLLADQDSPEPQPAPAPFSVRPVPKLEKPDDGPTDDGSHSERTSTDTHPGGIGTWGNLTLLNEVGRGGFGTVYRAWDAALAREVALKLIPVPEPDKEVARAVLAEGRLLARVRHPNVVTVFGAQQIGDQIGLWMEFVRGRTLQEIVERDGPMAADEASVIGMAVCSALIAVHAAGLVHRDVKTRNVMREAGGRIVLMDFGTGREVRQLASLPAYELAGTPQYMAPEVLAGSPASPGSDLYSVGTLLYQIVTGKYPIKGGTFAEVYWAHQRGERRPLTEWRADLPDAFVHVVDRALESNPEIRYRTAAQLKQDLATLVGRGATPQTVVSPIAPDAVTAGQTPRPVGALGEESARSAATAASAWQALRGARWLFVLVGLALLGFVSTTTFNLTMGRTEGFGAESPIRWIVWGVRSVIAPIAYMALAAAPVLLLVYVVGVMAKMSPLVRHGIARVRDRATPLVMRLNLDDPSVFAQALAAVATVVLAAISWRFRDLILGFTSMISEVDAASVRVLQPGNFDEHILYGRVLDMFLLVFGAGFVYVLRVRRQSGRPIGNGPAIWAVSILSLAILLWEMPYRILWHNNFERVDFGSTRCYEIGERGTQVLLHCPDGAPPRNRIVSADDSRLKHRGALESVFTPVEESLSRP